MPLLRPRYRPWLAQLRVELASVLTYCATLGRFASLCARRRQLAFDFRREWCRRLRLRSVSACALRERDGLCVSLALFSLSRRKFQGGAPFRLLRPPPLLLTSICVYTVPGVEPPQIPRPRPTTLRSAPSGCCRPSRQSVAWTLGKMRKPLLGKFRSRGAASLRGS